MSRHNRRRRRGRQSRHRDFLSEAYEYDGLPAQSSTVNLGSSITWSSTLGANFIHEESDSDCMSLFSDHMSVPAGNRCSPVPRSVANSRSSSLSRMIWTPGSSSMGSSIRALTPASTIRSHHSASPHGRACSRQPSYGSRSLQPIDEDEYSLPDGARASLHWLLTDEEIDACLASDRAQDQLKSSTLPKLSWTANMMKNNPELLFNSIACPSLPATVWSFGSFGAGIKV